MTGLSDTDIAWGAGLFEGEGCFTFTAGRPVACMNMKDLDVMERFASLFGGKVNGPYDGNRSARGWAPIYSWAISGYSAVKPFYELLQPQLGARRSARGAEVLAMYEALLEERANRSRFPRKCRAAGHDIQGPADEVSIGGKRPQCKACYRIMKRREYERRKERAA